MRRISRLLLYIIVLAMSMAAACATVYTATASECSSSPTGNHNWVHFNTADCTSGGADYWQCSYCYEEKDRTEVPALGHDWGDWITRMMPTCTENGSHYRQCRRCYESEMGSIPATGHSWDNGVVTKAASCTEAGVRTFTCKNDSSHTTTESIPALGHNQNTVRITKAATCTEKGTRTYSCDRCGTVMKTEDIPATGHSWDNGRVTKAATCTEAGVRTFTCRNDSSHTRIETVAALGHSWDNGKVTKAATCKEEGIKTYTCTRCGQTKTESIPKTAHRPETMTAKAATCKETGLTEGQKCSVCGEILKKQETVPKLEHTWGEGVLQDSDSGFLHDKTMLYTCKVCGETKTETIKVNTQNIFASLYSNPNAPSGGIADEAASILWISQQPENLEIPWNEGSSGTLTIKASGGTEPYTYKWVVVPGTEESSSSIKVAFLDKVNTSGSAFETAFNSATQFAKKKGGRTGSASAKPGIVGSMSDYWSDIKDKLKDAAEVNELAKLKRYEIIPANAAVTQTDVPQLQISPGDADSYTAWCIVTDSNGEYIKSDEVHIIPELSIYYQPGNVNIDDPGAVFTVGPIGGKTPYSYRWQYYDYASNDFENIKLSDAPDAGGPTLKPVLGFDEVRCVVTDANGVSVTSNSAKAYSAPVLEVSASDEVIYIRPGETATLAGFFTGGVAPYTAAWERFVGNEEILETFEIAKEPADSVFEHSLDSSAGDIYGVYLFRVTDSLGQEQGAAVEVAYRGLAINKQPQDGDLDLGGRYEASIEMGEGSLPFSFTLRDANQNDILSETVNSSSWSANISNSGCYYIYIEDGNGLHADSDFFQVGEYEVRITDQPDSIKIKSPYEYVQADLLVEGGEGPYRLTWMKKNEDSGNFETIVSTGDENAEPGSARGMTFQRTTDGWASISTNMTGTYRLLATDSNGITGVSRPFTAEYVGSAPYIKVQPQGAEYEAEGGQGRSTMSYTLDCEAETASGDELVYLWEYLDESGSWKKVPLQTMYARSPQYNSASAADYPHQVFKKVDSSRVYRCKVTNPKTGESTFSDTVFVKVLMKCVRAAQYRTDTALFAEYFGGAGPYKFYVREKYPPVFNSVQMLHGTDGDNRSYTLPTFVQYMDSNDDMGYFQLDYIGGQEQVTLAEYNCLVTTADQSIRISNINGSTYCFADGIARRWWPNFAGNTAHSYYHRVYQVMIEDRYGDTCTSPWMRMTSPMTTSEKLHNAFFYGLLGLEDTTGRDHSGW